MRIAIMLLTSALCGCGQVGPQCPAGMQQMIRAELVLGRNIGAVVGVNELDFVQFLDSEVTPRFPDGFTVSDGTGQWRAPTETVIVREPAKIIMVFAPGVEATRSKLTQIADSYKARFHQQSVIHAETPTCVSF